MTATIVGAPLARLRDQHLVEPGWLTEHLLDRDVLAVDCRFTGDRTSSRQAYRDGHIPGAVHVYWLDELCAEDTRVTTLLPVPETAARALGGRGIGPDTHVVAYADNSSLYATRLWHVLRSVGHAGVRLLDGGIEGWCAAGGGLEFGEEVRTPTALPLRTPLETPVDTGELRRRLGDPLLQVLDVRSSGEYTGTVVRAARGGHIPGAVLLPWDGLVDGQGRYRAPDFIRAVCRAAGVDPAREVVTYCQGGVRASHTAIALRTAGFERVRIYDGSWAVWGNDPSLPVVVGEGVR